MKLTAGEFRSLCDRTTDEITPHLRDLAEVYRVLRLEPDSGMTRKVVTGHLASEIRSHLPEDLTAVRHMLRRLKKAIILDHVVEGAPLEPYFSVARAIHDSARPGGAREGTSTPPDWETVIVAGRRLADLLPQTYRLPLSTIRQLFSRPFTVADAASRLRGAGYGLRFEDGSVRFADGVPERLAGDIEDHVRRLGGIEVARRAMSLLVPRYDETQQRFHLVRRVDAMGSNVRPDVPVGYMLHLAAKHISEAAPSADAESTWEKLIALSTDFATVHDLQPHSLWELEYKDDQTLIGFLQELALYDSFCCLRQMRPRDVASLIAGLFDWVTPDLEEKVGWRIGDVTAMVDALLAAVPNLNGGAIVDLDSIRGNLPEPSRGAASAVFEAFSHDPNTVNREFRLPTSRPFPDLLFRPIVSFRPGVGVLLNLPSVAPAFYEAVAAAFRRVEKRTDERIGTSAERFFETQLRARGVTPHCGEYHQWGVDGESDLVIETDDVVIFLEMKKKPLTRAAQAGGDLEILMDVAGGLFDALTQANGHELLLRKHGSLRLEAPDGSHYDLELRGRRVEKVAVTLLDYGAFQDRTVLFQLLRICAGGRFEAAAARVDAKKLDRLNQISTNLFGQLKQLAEHVPGYLKQPFINCWSLSLPQLLVMLDHVNSNESFWTELKSTRHISSHSLDWYFEYASLRGFRRS